MVLCRWIRRSRVVGTARSVRNLSSSAVSSSKSPSPSPSPSPLPLISLAPVVDGDGKVYRLRSLAADSSVIEVNTKRLAGDAEAELVGLSHGWVAMFNKRNNSLFLSDPLSHRRINLPPYHTLPDPIFSTDLDGCGSVSRVVLSSSPDDDDCRAVMIFGLGKRLAFCLPRRSSQWTPIGKPFMDRNDDCYRFVRFGFVHDDLVYCTRRKAFTSVSPCHFDYSDFQLWDRRVVSQENFYYVIRSQIHHWDWDTKKLRFHRHHSNLIALPQHQHKLKGGGGGGGATRMWLELNQNFLQEGCIHIPHIVYAEHSNQQFIVLRYVRLIGVEDGDGIPHCPEKGLEEVFECQTSGFLVLEINVRGQFELVEDLNGMAMFVGMDTSFAIPAEAAAANQLKANSIYFTDAKRSRMLCGVNDNGVFDYRNKTISPLA